MAILDHFGDGKSKIQIGPISIFTIQMEFLLQIKFIWAILDIKWKKRAQFEEILFFHPLLYGLPIVIRLAHAEISTGK